MHSSGWTKKEPISPRRCIAPSSIIHTIIQNCSRNYVTAWKVSKYGFFSGPYFPVFGLNAEIYSKSVNLRIHPNRGKYGPEKTPYLDTFHTVKRDINLFHKGCKFISLMYCVFLFMDDYQKLLPRRCSVMKGIHKKLQCRWIFLIRLQAFTVQLYWKRKFYPAVFLWILKTNLGKTFLKNNSGQLAGSGLFHPRTFIKPLSPNPTK